MCSNYQPVTRLDRLLTFFDVQRDRDEPPIDVFPLGVAPFIRLAPDANGEPARVAEDGLFGLLPYFATELAFGRRTYNARSETVATLPSFKEAWARGQRCVIPAEAIYEPSWETGKAVRWRVALPGDVPMGIAGIYAQWRHPDGRRLFTFAMLTVNATGHPVMQRFHRPEDEKRMVVILRPEDYDGWLRSSVADAPRYLQRWTGPLVTSLAPLPPRPPGADSGRAVIPRLQNGDLFS
jgi:putative SOS response-associated peptidase YedK